MARKRDLNRLENHLLAEEGQAEVSARVYNADHTDVDMQRYTESVCELPRKRSCLGFVILLLLAATAIFLYLAWGGSLPWS